MTYLVLLAGVCTMTACGGTTQPAQKDAAVDIAWIPGDVTAESVTPDGVADLQVPPADLQGAESETGGPDVSLTETDAAPENDGVEEPPIPKEPATLKGCAAKQFSTRALKVSYLAVDTTETGVITAENAPSGTYSYRNPLAKNPLLKQFLPQANTALADALVGRIGVAQSQIKTGPLIVAMEFDTPDAPITIFSAPFAVSVFGGYMRTFVLGLDPFCGYLEDNLTPQNICLYDLDLLSLGAMEGDHCAPRFRFSKAVVSTNPYGVEYLYAKQSAVKLILPLGGDAPLPLDLFDVEIDVTILPKKEAFEGIWLGFGLDVPDGILSGVVCSDQLAQLISAVQTLLPGDPVDLSGALSAVIEEIAKDPQLKVDPDPCATAERNAKGVPLVLRFRAIPARLGAVVDKSGK